MREWSKSDLTQGDTELFKWDISSHVSDNDCTPLSLFERFFDDVVINQIVTETLRYASQKSSHDFKITPADLKVFLGILIISGYVVLPGRRCYWSVDDDMRNIAVSNAMSRNDFEKMLRFLHVADNNKLDSSDKFAKITPLFKLLNERYLRYFQPAQNISVDESMVPYYGRHSAKQFIRGKPIRFGYKVWCCCTSTGYLIRFEPYQGAQVAVAEDPYKSLGVGGAVVMRLTLALPRAPYIIHTDNYFSTIKLAVTLKEKGMGLVGTVRSNRIEKCPIPSLDKTERGAVEYRKDRISGVILIRWNDNNIVNVVSSAVGVYPMNKASRWSKVQRKRISVDQPNAIATYNRGMGGVDLMDRNISSYRISIRSKKWWWPLFRYSLDTSIQNAWLLYRQSAANNRDPLTQLQFRRRLANLLLLKYSTESLLARRQSGPRRRQKVADEIRTDGLHHYQGSLPSMRRCAQCKKTVTKQCLKCLVPLHDKCVVAFHT